MQTEQFDAVVIGSGPGGEGAAMRLVKGGKKVTLIEAHSQVGGACTHWGTIPSKALRQNIQSLMEYRQNPLFSRTVGQLDIDYPNLLASAGDVVQEQVNTRFNHYARNGVEVIHGFAHFSGANEIVVSAEGQVSRTLGFEHAIIATGSRPYHPDDVDFDQPRVLDADTVLDLAHSPRSITIYGAGVIGCEYASIFCNLGLKVNLVNTRDRLLEFLDDEITDALSYTLRDQGVVIRHNETYTEVKADDSGIALYCESGKQFSSDYLLWANGRSGNAAKLGLDKLDVVVNHREQIEINSQFQTTQDHIYAVGDVVGPPGLASASYDQGRYVATLICDGNSEWSLIKDVPTGIYTSPEISSLGKTERELTADKIPYDVAHAPFKSIARAQITGRTVGMLKILFHTETLEILGIHCFGDNAAEIIHIGQAIMHQPGQGNTLRYFAENTFNYPTMAEAYRVAALNGLNRVGRAQ